MCACIYEGSWKATCNRYNMTGIMCACIYVDSLKASCDRYNMAGIMCVLAFMYILWKLVMTGIIWQV